MYKEPIDSQHDYPLNTILFHPRGSLSYVAYNFNEIVIKSVMLLEYIWLILCWMFYLVKLIILALQTKLRICICNYELERKRKMNIRTCTMTKLFHDRISYVLGDDILFLIFFLRLFFFPVWNEYACLEFSHLLGILCFAICRSHLWRWLRKMRAW